MSGNTPKIAGNPPAPAADVAKMSAVVEAHHLIRDIAGPQPVGMQIQEMLTLVARRTGLGIRRLRGIWNNEARSIRAEEIDALRAAAVARRREQREEADREEYRALLRRIDLLEQRLAEIGPQLAGRLDGARRQADSAGRDMDRTMVEGR